MKKHRKISSKKIVIFSIAILIFSCSKDSSDSPSIDDLREGCYYAYTSPDNAYLRIINTLDVNIYVEYVDLPYGANIQNESCALCGVLSNTSSAIRIQRCESGGYDSDGRTADCGNNGPVVRISYNLQSSETEEIIVDSNTFK